YIAEKSADLFSALGLKIQEHFALELAGELKDAVRKNLIDFDSMTVIPRCQTAQAICIYYGIFNADEKEKASKVLLDIIHDGGDKIDCGMIGMRVIFHILSDIGEGALAYKMITRTDYPSYGMFVRRGLTALPEDFQPDEDHDWANSLNHHFFGDIESWFIQKVAGIEVNPGNTSADEFVIHPDFNVPVEFAEAFFEAPCGRIEVRWDKNESGAVLSLKVPAGAKGIIRAPAGYVFEDGGDTVLELAPGTISFIKKD
ncbi:MAG: hypothetical protein IK097_04765, partial [Clostridia bacterium]|nr:hypothetical protein [Clostridia bacterium]